METLTGLMIAGFIFFSGKLISAGELEVNNFFSFLAAMMLAYQPIRALANYKYGCLSRRRIYLREFQKLLTKRLKLKMNLS